MNELLKITETLCDSIRSQVCGCEGCWLFDENKAPNFDYEKDCPFCRWKIKNGLTE